MGEEMKPRRSTRGVDTVTGIEKVTFSIELGCCDANLQYVTFWSSGPGQTSRLLTASSASECK